MNNLVVVGCQWGDEGKGKLVDYLGDKADIIVRFQGVIMQVIQLSLVIKFLNYLCYLLGF